MIEKDNPQILIEALRQAEHDRIEKEVLIEREWWAGEAINDPLAAIESGFLVKVPDEGLGYRLIGSLRRGEESPYLIPDALEMLSTIARKWHEKIESAGLDSNCYLSITSLFRSHEEQEKTRKETYRATKGVSPHTSGVVVDFDPRGYFLGESRNSINWLSDDFDKRYIQYLKETLDEFEGSGYVHVINEKNYDLHGDKVVEFDTCYHVCLAKQTQPDSK